MLWNEGIAEYGFDCKVRKLSPKTIENYQKQLRYFQRYLQSEFELGEIEQVKPYHIKQFLAWISYQKNRIPCKTYVQSYPGTGRNLFTSAAGISGGAGHLD